MAVPPSQRPRRVAPAYRAQQPSPLVPLAVISQPNDTLLVVILTLSFIAFLFLPPIATRILNQAPLTTTPRILGFYAGCYGLWGLAVFTWACCRYSIGKGQAWGWGLAALLGIAAPLALFLTAQPIAGLFGVLGLAGLLLPYALGEDRIRLITTVPRTTAAAAINWSVALLLFAGVSIAYGNSFYGGMTLDNKYIIEEYYKTLLMQDSNLKVLSWKMLSYIVENDYWWPKGISGLYRPLATFSYWANYVVANNQLDPFQYHVVNFFLHWLAAFFGFLLLRLITKRTLVAALAALLFATHPIATESVTNIIGRADVLAACATFAGTVMYVRSTMTIGWRRWTWLIGLMWVTFLGLLAKESAIAVVGVAVAYDVVYRWTRDDLIEGLPSLLAFSLVGAVAASIALLVGSFGFLGLSEGVRPALWVALVTCAVAALAVGIAMMARIKRGAANELWKSENWNPWRKYFLAYLTFLPPILAWIAARSKVFANASPPETPFLDNPIRGLGFFSARMTASDVFLRLLRLLMWPLHLSCDYSFNQIPLFNGHPTNPETWMAVMGLFTLIALLLLAYLLYRRQKAICFLILFYLIVYLPTSNFLIIIGSIMAERFLYLPLLAFTGCLVLILDLIFRRFGVATRRIFMCSIVGLLTIACCCRTWERNKDWLSDLTLWASAIKVSPNSFRSYQSGAFAMFEKLNEREATNYYKDDPAAHEQDIDRIILTAEHAEPIVDVLPAAENSSRLYLHLGMYYTRKADLMAHPTAQDTIPPDDPSRAWYQMAVNVLEKGVVIDRTFNEVNRAKEIARGKKSADIADVGLPPIYFFLGYAYSRLSDWPRALQAYEYLVHLDPGEADTYIKIAMTQLHEGRNEAAAASILQAMLLPNRNLPNIWPLLASAFSTIQPDGAAVVRQDKTGRLQLNLDTRAGRSMLCLAYQNSVRTFLLCKQRAVAKHFASAAEGQSHFPPALFEDLLNSHDDTGPTPPMPQ